MLVIRGGRVIDPASGHDAVADVLVERGRIQRIGPDLATEVGSDVRVIDATRCWITPGFVDLHVHFREPGQEYKEDIESGLRAAAAGGFTTVCPMANTSPVNDNRAITETMIARARSVTGPHLRPFGAITKGLAGSELSEMADLREAGAIGVSDDGRCVMDALVMRRAMEYARTFDLLVSQHCEDHRLTAGAQMHEGRVSTRLGLRGWPREAEDIIVARDLILTGLTRTRYHVAHISSRGALPWLREAKDRGQSVSAEVTPHHLSLTDEAVVGYRTHCKVNPPLREEEDREALIAALADGTIDCIATDHAPHSTLEKECEFEAASLGINGLETALPTLLGLVRQEKLSVTRLIEALTVSPARLLGDRERGRLNVGAPADIAIIDPERRWSVSSETLHSKSHNSPWLHQELQGKVVFTLVDGTIAYEHVA